MPDRQPIPWEDLERDLIAAGASPEEIAEGARRLLARRGEPRLSPGEVRSLLRECVTVVKPGETLVVRLSCEYTPAQVREVQDCMDAAREYADWPRVMVVPGDELGVVEGPIPPEPVDEAALAQMPQPRRWDYPAGWGDRSDA